MILPTKTTRLQISLVSLLMAVVILALKFLAYIFTGSVALKSDAMESVVNVASAFFTVGPILFADRPADKSHPYGHGKIEYFSAAFEGGLISLASILILYEAASAWIEGPHVKELGSGIWLNLGAGTLNGLLGWWLLRAGRKNNSKAIEADGHHVLSDFYTTLGLAGGLIIVKMTGYYWLDSALAAAIGLFLAYTGFKLIRESSNALLDHEDPELIGRLVETLQQTRPLDVIEVHALRTFRSGRYTHVDIHVSMPEFYSLEKAHDLVDAFGEKTLSSLNLEGEFHAHLDPCRQLYCKNCPVSPCPIRQAPFVEIKPFSLEKAVSIDPDEIYHPRPNH
ncbi:MAG TPA: cation transporter [Deltaproteobacteria bacterium]|nr:cation transporter [Deltaproteobacteria bacterium]